MHAHINGLRVYVTVAYAVYTYYCNSVDVCIIESTLLWRSILRHSLKRESNSSLCMCIQLRYCTNLHFSLGEFIYSLCI